MLKMYDNFVTRTQYVSIRAENHSWVLIMSDNLRILPYICPYAAFWQHSFQTLLHFNVQAGVTVHHIFMIFSTINEKGINMQFAKFRVYTLKLNTIF